MAQVSIEDRFRGSCNLVILHLRRAAQSNDREAGFDTARNMGMIDADQEAFIRHCFNLYGRLEQGEPLDEPITEDLIKRLQLCALSLNTADPA